MESSKRLADVLREHASRRSFGSAHLREAFPVLIEALDLDEPVLLVDHACWAASVAAARGDRANDMAKLFRALQAETANLHEPADRRSVSEFLAVAEAMAHGAARTAARGPLSRPDAYRYLESLLAYDEELALAIVQSAMTPAFTLQDVYAYVIEPALIEAGRRWEAATMSVFQEHYVTGATLRIMNRLCKDAPRSPRRPRTFLGLCVQEERHEVGLQMIRDQLYLNGWRTVSLGADVPTEEIPTLLRETEPTVVGLSVTLAAHLGHARDAIACVREHDRRVRIVIGGRPFRDGGSLWAKLGADAGPRNATEATAVIEALADDALAGC